MFDTCLIKQLSTFLVIWFDASNIERLLDRNQLSLNKDRVNVCVTFEERRLERVIMEFRDTVPTVIGHRITDVILFSPSGHMADTIGL